MKLLTKSIQLVLLLSICSIQLQSQELHIYYNLHNDDVTYEKEGVKLTEPKIKQGDDIVLHLTEYNHYLHKVALEISQEHFTEQTANMSDASLMSGLIPGMGMPGIGSGLSMFGLNGSSDSTNQQRGLLDIPLLTINDSPITLLSLFKGSRGADQVLQKLEGATNEVSSTLEEMNAVSKNVRSLRKTATVSKMAMEYVQVLKNHPHLKPSLVKSMCEEYYEAIFRKNASDGINLSDVLNLQDDGMKYQSLINDLSALQGKLTNKLKQLTMLSKQYKSFDLDDDAYQKYSRSLNDFMDRSTSINDQLKNSVNDSNAVNYYPTIKQLTELQLQLAEVISNEFTYYSRFQAKGDRLSIHIELLDRNNGENEEATVVKSRWLYYESKGGLKFTGSVGLNFSQFFDPSQSYGVNNGVIVAEDDGDFSPTVTSFLHFYSYSGKKVSLGGSFGIGFPLAGEGDNQALQFFAGPSLIFGGTQRFILNFGLTGGRVTRLGRGFKEGDEFDLFQGDIPTRNPYELGFFIGASFNLMGQ